MPLIVTSLPCYTPVAGPRGGVGVCGIRHPGMRVGPMTCMGCPENPGKIHPEQEVGSDPNNVAIERHAAQRAGGEGCCE